MTGPERSAPEVSAEPSAELRVIARAIARSAIYYKRSALISGLLALALCPAVVLLEPVQQKGVALGLAMVLTVFTYRSIRATQRYFDPEISPLLTVLARCPETITRVTCERSKGNDPAFVVVEDAEGQRLKLRIPSEVIDVELPALLDALASIAPSAIVDRGPNS